MKFKIKKIGNFFWSILLIGFVSASDFQYSPWIMDSIKFPPEYYLIAGLLVLVVILVFIYLWLKPSSEY